MIMADSSFHTPPPVNKSEHQSSSGRKTKSVTGKKKSTGNKKKPVKYKNELYLHSAKTQGKLIGMMGALTLEHIQKQPQGVGLVYDERLLETHSHWDPNFPEKPERISAAWERCQHYGLVNRCVRILARMATEEDILLRHSQDFYNLVKDSAEMTPDQLKLLSTKFDTVYFHEKTYESAMLAAGSVIELVDQIINEKIRHGMAITRPPGHHAQHNEPNGYCIFNNVAIAAEYALEHLEVQRILIVDWDVHHGQGIQYMFYDDPRVLYFSIHRYEHGTFWPNLRQSDYDYIGTGKGKGFNINVPFNKTGMTNADYITILLQVLMPVSYEFDPELVLVSCGYDAAVGDPEGASEVTPACYAHMAHMLKPLANGRLCVVLEGGYCIKSQAEAVAHTLNALLGEPCPMLGQLQEPMTSTKESILQVIRVLRPYWECFAYHEDTEAENALPEIFVDIVIPKPDIKFVTDETRPETFALANDYEYHDPENLVLMDNIVETALGETKLLSIQQRTCLVYDERMTRHKCEDSYGHPERPDRITAIYEQHQQCGLLERCQVLQSRTATEEELGLVHKVTYIGQMRKFQDASNQELRQQSGSFNSIYLSKEAYECAALATGCTLNLVDEVMSGKCLNGVAITRPPGHHAEPHTAMGFCYFNSVAVAAKYAQIHHEVSRVLILDWDVHHGNGTQHMFEDDSSVLYISIHRYDHGCFFPSGQEGNFDVVGEDHGKGFNINIPWNKRSMGDDEYMAAFQQIVMPVAFEYCPELVLVSAGFDAARGDSLGGCKVSPECYGQMTHMLSSLANGRVILVLEGGYNLHSISQSMSTCTSVLLGDQCPYLSTDVPCDSAIESIHNVLDTHQHYWKSLQFRVNMPTREQTKLWLKSTQSTEPSEVIQDSPRTDVKSEELVDGDTHASEVKVEGVEPLETNTCTEAPSKETTQPPGDPSVDSLTADLTCMSLSQETKKDLPKEDDIATGSTEDATGSTEDATATGSTEVISGPSNQQEEELVGACGGSEPKGAIGSLAQNQDGLELYSVVPLPWCPHLEMVTPVPSVGLDTSAPCGECANIGENWVCLTCYQVFCSRYVQEHMLMHSLATEHLMALSYADLSVWCYACDNYVHNEMLFEAKRAAHIHKFGEEVPRH